MIRLSIAFASWLAIVYYAAMRMECVRNRNCGPEDMLEFSILAVGFLVPAGILFFAIGGKSDLGGAGPTLSPKWDSRFRVAVLILFLLGMGAIGYDVFYNAYYGDPEAPLD